MAYSTAGDLQKQLSDAQLQQLTDDENTGVIDYSVIAKAIADADAEIDTYAAGRYSVPLAPVPAVINRYSVDMAIYNLYSRRANVPQHRMDRYNAALSWLKQLAQGLTTLGEATPQRSSDQLGGPKNAVSSDDRVMTSGNGTSTAGTMDNF